MASPVMPLRALVGVGALTAALGLSLLAPATASTAAAAAAGSARTASASTVTATAVRLPVLRSGSRGTYVKRVQVMLGIPVTGVFGRRTVIAVKRFQVTHRITPASGIVASKTWVALGRYWAAKSRAIAAHPPAAAAPRPSGDATMSSAARASRSARVAVTLAVWKTSAHGRMIVRRESGGKCTAVSAGGLYRGKWQMSSYIWTHYSGGKYGATADKATCAQQDVVAYRVWVSSWWRPWGG